jgi:hypothetical protein
MALSKKEATAQISELLVDVEKKFAEAQTIAKKAGLQFNWFLPEPAEKPEDWDDEEDGEWEPTSSPAALMPFSEEYGWDSSTLCW